MGCGKSCSQAGHAALGTFLQAPKDLQDAYHKDGIGTKVCLACPNLSQLQTAYETAVSLGLPADYIVDSGCPDFFGGQPTPTAVGIGPITRAQAKFLKKFQLLK
jgi:peptidyl-tRNA hydrolase